jgi:outer membrane protein TolC
MLADLEGCKTIHGRPPAGRRADRPDLVAAVQRPRPSSRAERVGGQNLDVQLATTPEPVPPSAPVRLPGKLARRRADIRQTEADRPSATAEIAVAVASFYPTVTLSGRVGIQALWMKEISDWDAHHYFFDPAISIAIFEGGRLKANLALGTVQSSRRA